VTKLNGVSIGEEIAVKIMDEDPRIYRDSPEVRKEFLGQVQILASLHHPGCLKLIGFSLQGSSTHPRPTIITKWMSNGSLDNVIKKELEGKAIPGWNPTKKSICIFGIAAALKYIHSLKVIDRKSVV
jgi:serine/threonine protein kinase